MSLVSLHHGNWQEIATKGTWTLQTSLDRTEGLRHDWHKWGAIKSEPPAPGGKRVKYLGVVAGGADHDVD